MSTDFCVFGDCVNSLSCSLCKMQKTNRTTTIFESGSAKQGMAVFIPAAVPAALKKEKTPHKPRTQGVGPCFHCRTAASWKVCHAAAVCRPRAVRKYARQTRAVGCCRKKACAPPLSGRKNSPGWPRAVTCPEVRPFCSALLF